MYIDVPNALPLSVGLDSKEVDITAVAADLTVADRTIAAAELWKLKNGDKGEIFKIELIAIISYVDTSGVANYLECSNAAFNQWQISDDAVTFDDCPFKMEGGETGQHVAGDMHAQADGAGGLMLVADISDLTNSTYKEDADARYVLKLQNAEALGNNLRLRVTTIIKIYYER